MTYFPSRSHARRRDRHGRGLRGPIFDPSSPAVRTRAQKFDDVIASELERFSVHLGARMERYDFAVLDVPGADPAPWEDGVPLTRYLPFERPSKIHGRIIFYRRPIEHEALRHDDPQMIIHAIMVNQIADAMNMDPREVDYLA